MLKYPTRCAAALANVTHDFLSWPTIANAHAMLASACALNSLNPRSAALADVENSFSSDCSAVAKAHAVLASLILNLDQVVTKQ